MPRVSVSTTVPASSDRTWGTACDLSRFGEWLVLHVGWRGEVPDTVELGTKVTSVVTVLGLRKRISWLIDSYDPPRSLHISGRGVDGTQVSLTFTVSSEGDQSTVEIDTEVTGPTTIGLMGMLIGRALKGDMRTSVARLTDLLS